MESRLVGKVIEVKRVNTKRLVTVELVDAPDIYNPRFTFQSETLGLDNEVSIMVVQYIKPIDVVQHERMAQGS